MEKLKLSNEDGNKEIDSTLWENFGAKLESVLEDLYMTAQTAVFAPGELIDITLADNDTMPKCNEIFVNTRQCFFRCAERQSSLGYLPPQISAHHSREQTRVSCEVPQNQIGGKNSCQSNPWDHIGNGKMFELWRHSEGGGDF